MPPLFMRRINHRPYRRVPPALPNEAVSSTQSVCLAGSVGVRVAEDLQPPRIAPRQEPLLNRRQGSRCKAHVLPNATALWPQRHSNHGSSKDCGRSLPFSRSLAVVLPVSGTTRRAMACADLIPSAPNVELPIPTGRVTHGGRVSGARYAQWKTDTVWVN